MKAIKYAPLALESTTSNACPEFEAYQPGVYLDEEFAPTRRTSSYRIVPDELPYSTQAQLLNYGMDCNMSIRLEELSTANIFSAIVCLRRKSAGYSTFTGILPPFATKLFKVVRKASIHNGSLEVVIFKGAYTDLASCFQLFASRKGYGLFNASILVQMLLIFRNLNIHALNISNFAVSNPEVRREVLTIDTHFAKVCYQIPLSVGDMCCALSLKDFKQCVLPGVRSQRYHYSWFFGTHPEIPHQSLDMQEFVRLRHLFLDLCEYFYGFTMYLIPQGIINDIAFLLEDMNKQGKFKKIINFKHQANARFLIQQFLISGYPPEELWPEFYENGDPEKRNPLAVVILKHRKHLEISENYNFLRHIPETHPNTHILPLFKEIINWRKYPSRPTFQEVFLSPVFRPFVTSK
jgi:hypothetical protein